MGSKSYQGSHRQYLHPQKGWSSPLQDIQARTFLLVP